MILLDGNIFLTADEMLPNSTPETVLEFSTNIDLFKLNAKKISSSGIF